MIMLWRLNNVLVYGDHAAGLHHSKNHGNPRHRREIESKLKCIVSDKNGVNGEITSAVSSPKML